MDSRKLMRDSIRDTILSKHREVHYVYTYTPYPETLLEIEGRKICAKELCLLQTMLSILVLLYLLLMSVFLAVFTYVLFFRKVSILSFVCLMSCLGNQTHSTKDCTNRNLCPLNSENSSRFIFCTRQNNIREKGNCSWRLSQAQNLNSLACTVFSCGIFPWFLDWKRSLVQTIFLIYYLVFLYLIMITSNYWSISKTEIWAIMYN